MTRPLAGTEVQPEQPVEWGPGLRLLVQVLALALLVALFFPLGTSVAGIRVVTADLALMPLAAVVIAVWAMAPATASLRFHLEDKVGALLLVVLLISSGLAMKPAVAIDQWLVWVRAGAVLMLLRWLMANGLLSLDRLVNWLAAILGLLVFIGLVQLVTDSNFGLLANYVGQNLEEGARYQGERRLSGTTPESNVFGQWLVMLGGLVTARMLQQRRPGAWGGLLVTLVVLPLLIATLARANLFFFLLVFGYIWLRWVFRSRNVFLVPRLIAAELAFISVGLGALMLLDEGGVLFYLIERFMGGDTTRLNQIQHGVELLSDPKILLFGTGLGSFYDALEASGIGITQLELWHFVGTRVGIHNAFLLILTEAGVVAFLALAAYVLALFVRIRRSVPVFARRGRQYLGPYLLIVFLGFVFVPMQLYMSAIGYPTLLVAAVLLTLLYGTLAQERLLTSRGEEPVMTFGEPW